MTPPLLFGWSSYQPEGLLVTCSWDYMSRNFSNRLYYVYLLVFGYIVPVTVLIFCYFAIFRFIMRSAKDITRLILTRDGRVHFSTTVLPFLEHRNQTLLSLSSVSLAHSTMTARCSGSLPWRHPSRLFCQDYEIENNGRHCFQSVGLRILPTAIPLIVPQNSPPV